jgi:hypothetical protein
MEASLSLSVLLLLTRRDRIALWSLRYMQSRMIFSL